MIEHRQELHVADFGSLKHTPSYGEKSSIRTWYFSLPGQEHVPGRYTLRFREYESGDSQLQIKKNPLKIKFPCDLDKATRIFSLEEKTGDDKVDKIISTIGKTQVIFSIASNREHRCNGINESVRVTSDTDIKVYSPRGNCVGLLADRYECKIYVDQDLESVLLEHKLTQTKDVTQKRIEAFRIIDQISMDTYKLLPGREVEIKFDVNMHYQKIIREAKNVPISQIQFLWQPFEETEVNDHIYYLSSGGVYRTISVDGHIQAIVRKSLAQNIDREESLCDKLPSDARVVGEIHRTKHKMYLTDTQTGHCFQLAVDESVRKNDGAILTQLEAEYIRSIYPWSAEETIRPSLEKLQAFLAQSIPSIKSTLRRKIDFVCEAEGIK